MPQNSYHTDLIIAYKSGALKSGFLSKIPSSTLHNWKHRNTAQILGLKEAGLSEENLNMVRVFLTRKKAIKLAKAAYHVFKTYESVADKSKLFRKELFRFKEKVVKVIEHIRPAVGLKKALSAFYLSSQQYYRWKSGNSCRFSFFDNCLKRQPNQLTEKEVGSIKQYLNKPELLHWPLASVYYQMLRDGVVAMSLNTWYKYAGQLITQRKAAFRKRFRKKKYKGLKADKVFQYLHMDVTLFRPADNSKLFLYFIQDNYSKAILSWRASTECCASICMENLREAVERFGLTSYDSKVICDGGPENKGETDEYLQSIPVEKLIAGKDIPFSNSLVEAFNKRIKYRFLFHQDLPDIDRTLDYLPSAIEEYNDQPLLVLKGNTPNEVLDGKDPQNRRFEDPIKQAVSKRITENNQNRCSHC